MESLFASDAVGPSYNLCLDIIRHAVVQDDIGGFLKVDSGTVGDAVDEQDIDISFFEFVNFLFSRFHRPGYFGEMDSIVVKGVADKRKGFIVIRKEDKFTVGFVFDNIQNDGRFCFLGCRWCGWGNGDVSVGGGTAFRREIEDHVGGDHGPAIRARIFLLEPLEDAFSTIRVLTARDQGGLVNAEKTDLACFVEDKILVPPFQFSELLFEPCFFLCPFLHPNMIVKAVEFIHLVLGFAQEFFFFILDEGKNIGGGGSSQMPDSLFNVARINHVANGCRENVLYDIVQWLVAVMIRMIQGRQCKGFSNKIIVILDNEVLKNVIVHAIGKQAL